MKTLFPFLSTDKPFYLFLPIKWTKRAFPLLLEKPSSVLPQLWNFGVSHGFPHRIRDETQVQIGTFGAALICRARKPIWFFWQQIRAIPCPSLASTTAPTNASTD